MNRQPSGESVTPHEPLKTLGVLFVHGIGTQRRGDTLAQCGSAIHRWLQGWVEQPEFEQGRFDVELLDAELAQGQEGGPAHTRLAFRKGNVLSERTWLFAESCWSEAFRPPTYLEFVRWALWGVPLAVILHLLASFRRDLRVMRATDKAINGKPLGWSDLWQLKADLGADGDALNSDPITRRNFLINCSVRAGTRWFISPFVLALFLLVAASVLAILLLIGLIGLLPIGFLRSFALWAQKKVATVLGDSYLFVASPICASAVVAQLKRDFRWLSERTDQVVVIAHSQGAAVTFRAVQEWSWESRLPEKLKLVISYGSGLQKLFALTQLSRDTTRDKTRTISMAIAAAVFGMVGAMIPWLWILAVAPLWAAAIGFVASFILLMLSLFFFDKAFDAVDPALPVGLRWINLYASDDPVSSGAITVRPPELGSTGSAALDEAYRKVSEFLTGDFNFAQQEVVNLKSSLADHTRYWSAEDDFVARVVLQLLRASDLPSLGTLDSEWLEVAVRRRRWRVGIRAGCRNAAIVAALCVAIWPHAVVAPLGNRFSGFVSTASSRWAIQWLVDWMPRISISDWLAGIAALVLCIGASFALAAMGWQTWERREFGQFFRREPFRPGGPGLLLFALGWVGVVAVVPAVTIYGVGGQAVWPSVWTASLLLAMSGWTIAKFGAGPGQPSTWVSALLTQGEGLLERTTGDRLENLARAQLCFSHAGKWLMDRSGNTTDRIRMLLGLARVLEESEQKDDKVVKQLRALYDEALIALRQLGRDTHTVEAQLAKLPSDATRA